MLQELPNQGQFLSCYTMRDKKMDQTQSEAIYEESKLLGKLVEDLIRQTQKLHILSCEDVSTELVVEHPQEGRMSIPLSEEEQEQTIGGEFLEHLENKVFGLLPRISEQVANIQKVAKPSGFVSAEQSIDNLDLSVRATKSLQDGGVRTLQQLLTKSSKDLLKLKSFGNTTLEEVRKTLAKRGLHLKGE